MALTNLNNTHLPQATVNDVNEFLTVIENALAIINTTLTAEDRQRYGSINEQNKLFVNKVFDFNNSQPALSTAQVDWMEFNNNPYPKKNTEIIPKEISQSPRYFTSE